MQIFLYLYYKYLARLREKRRNKENWGKKEGREEEKGQIHTSSIITLFLSLLHNTSVKGFKMTFVSQHTHASNIEILCEQVHELEKRLAE